MSHEKKLLDSFEEKLEIKIKELQECQKLSSLNSCTPCDKFFTCELRKDYVKSVYESMSKGSTGGFEF